MARRDASAADRFQAVADELYALSPADFTAARDTHAAQLRRDGERDLAARVAALRRPTMAAWAGNVLVRARPEEVAGVLELGAALREAHRDLDGTRLRALSAQQRALTMALARQARALTVKAGRPLSEQGVLEVRGTVQAALADPDAARAWAGGCLDHPLTPPAFPAVAGAGTRPAGPVWDLSDEPAKRRSAKPAPRAAADDLERARVRREARARRDEAVRDAETAAVNADRAQAAVEAAREQAHAAQERREEARGHVAELRRELADAEQAEHDAAEDERRTRDRVREAERALPGARRRAREAERHAAHLARQAADGNTKAAPASSRGSTRGSARGSTRGSTRGRSRGGQ
ncbi:hypothetical protein [Yinghuangia soli]|uniref:Uncharacterized protein n=1 Tax=Yinghuangia soli TaxID=2908204 RepID=A0AA41U2K1_9ACTN|nr:hypothetical protein [Yinghuangia soli]MCF2527189.1 hypothetical protein [Yinghuangia soli]